MDDPLATKPTVYGGDAALAALLRQDASPYDVAEVRAILAGLLAAPEQGGEEWTMLIAPSPSPALKSALLALAAMLRAAPKPAIPDAAERLALLRAELARRGVQGFLVPRADEHQGEYVP